MMKLITFGGVVCLMLGGGCGGSSSQSPPDGGSPDGGRGDGPAFPCGNGLVDPGEICDGDCPASCDAAAACTTDTTSGSAATCDLVCGHQAITQCLSGDGCCPAGCAAADDSDCSPVAACVPGEYTWAWTFDFDCSGYQLGGFRFYYGRSRTTMTSTVDVSPDTHCGPSAETNGCGIPILACSYTFSGLTPGFWAFSLVPYNSFNQEGMPSGPRVEDLSCPDVSGCPDLSSTITSDRGFYINGGAGDQVWGYVATDDPIYYEIMIHDAAAHGGPTAPGTYDFTAQESDNFTCGLCVTVYRGQRIFMPRPGGTYTLTTLTPAGGGHFAGALHDLVLQEVTIDPLNLTTIPVPGGQLQCLTDYAWDVVMQ